MKEIFEAVRSACPAPVWSRGVQLSRADAVRAEPREEDGEISFRVRSKQRLVSPIATLYVEELDWECNCGGSDDPCEHVAAAVIAWRQARKDGRSLEGQRAEGAVRYELSRVGGGLEFERFIVTSNGSELLTTTLEALASGRVDGPRVSPSQVDVAVEVALGPARRGRLPRGVLHRVLEQLARGAPVQLDGESIQLDWTPVMPSVRVADVPDGVRLELVPEARVDERFEDEIVRCGQTLRPLGEAALDGRERSLLVPGRIYTHGELAELATEILPDLGKRLLLRVESEKLPRTSDRERPRVVIDSERRGDRLSLLASLVYGSPPSARVDAGKLVHLKGPVPIRDVSAEQAQVRNLRDKLGLVPGHRADLASDDALELARALESWPGEVRGTAHREFRPVGQLSARLEPGDSAGGFGVHFAAGEDAGKQREPRGGADSVLRAWQRGESWVALQGGGFAELPTDWLQRFGNRVADLLAARDESGRLPTSALPDLGRLCEELDQPPPPALARLAPLLEATTEVGEPVGLPAAELPRDLVAELRPYQRVGVDWLCFLRELELGALLADDMGLGKTLQALCAIEGPALVVAPTSVLHTWKREAERFRPDLSLSIYHGPRRVLDPDAEVTVTSYALLRLDLDKLAARSWRCVVLDEAQAIKNPESQVARAAFQLDGRFRIAITGTPVENRLEELWSQVHFLNRGLLGGRRDFQERYAGPIAAGSAAEPDGALDGSQAAARLRERLRPFILRRRKQEVAPELPARSEVVLLNELTASEREVYDAVRAASVPSALERLDAGGNVLAALEALLRLRQAACHPALVPGQAASSSSKLELLCERLDQAVSDGHKALVFSQWTSLLDKLEPLLDEHGIARLRLDGSTRDRQAVVDGFQDEQGAPVLLASLKAGGTGLTLTAADHVFLLDPWWNPAVEDQAADRAHRIGQTRPVIVHRLVSAGTVEEQILALQGAKRELSRLALEDAERTPELTRNELRALLEDVRDDPRDAVGRFQSG